MDIWQKFDQFKSKIKDNLLDGGITLENEMHSIVAIKTGKLDESIKTENVEESSPNTLKVSVGSKGVEYAKYVDLGVKGQTFDYHRHKKTVWTGVGQDWRQRALDAKKDEILKTIFK